MADLESVISGALSQCEPSLAELKKIDSVAERCKDLVSRAASDVKEVVEVVFGGSFAKGTWLRGGADIDVFVKMDPALDLESFEELGKKIGKTALAKYGPRLRYSDHPYVEAVIDGTRVNVVPCYDVEQGKWQSAADRSPFHTEYIRAHFGDFEKGQTRLLKAFFKSAGIYGAEISVGGFSGYVSEVLVLKYRSFEKVLRAAADLTHRQVIAINDQFDPDVVKGFSSPLVIIDPVDTRRNLGTAISPESVGNFVLAARSFLSSPSAKYFKSGPLRRAPRAVYSNILIVEFRHKEKSPDVIWGQLRRSLGAVAKQLELADFEVFRASCASDEKGSGAMAFLLGSLTLPPFTKRKGPEIYMRDNSASFLTNSKTRPHVAWVDADMRAAVLASRKVTDAKGFVRSLFGGRSNGSGITMDMLADRPMLRIYSGREKRLAGVARDAADRIVSTEHFIPRA